MDANSNLLIFNTDTLECFITRSKLEQRKNCSMLVCSADLWDQYVLYVHCSSGHHHEKNTSCKCSNRWRKYHRKCWWSSITTEIETHTLHTQDNTVIRSTSTRDKRYVNIQTNNSHSTLTAAIVCATFHAAASSVTATIMPTRIHITAPYNQTQCNELWVLSQAALTYEVDGYANVRLLTLGTSTMCITLTANHCVLSGARTIVRRRPGRCRWRRWSRERRAREWK